MYKFLVNHGQQLAFGVGILVTILFLGVAYSGLDAFSALPEEEQASTSIFDVGLKGALVLTVVAAAAMVLFGLWHIFGNFKNSVKGLIGVGLLVVIFIVAYATASGTPEVPAIADAANKVGGISEGQMKFIGGSITTAVVLTAIAALAFVFSELRNFFK